MNVQAEEMDPKLKNGRLNSKMDVQAAKMDVQAEKNGRSNWEIDAQPEILTIMLKNGRSC